jgi:cytochrome c peroxidase
MRLARRVGTSLPAILFSLFFAGNALALDASEEDYNLKLLGKYVFFDKISNPERMACVTCHDPTTGGTGSVSGVNLHQVAITGANPHKVGGLKPPTNAYASFVAPYHACGRGGLAAPPFLVPNHCGGNFWNGRAEGATPALFAAATKHIGDEVFQGISSPPLRYANYFGPTSDQALNPMPNTVEQNIDRQSVCRHVAAAKYAPLYSIAWGVAIDCSDTPASTSAPDVTPPEKQFDISFKRLMLAVGAWQHSKELNSFSSKRDIALRAELKCQSGTPDADPAVCSHPNYVNSPGKFPLVGLTDQENLGHDLFYNTRRLPFARATSAGGPPNNDPPFPNLPQAQCSFCHSDDHPGHDGSEPEQLYSDDAYHNIGTPLNPELPADPNVGVAGHMPSVDVSVNGQTVTRVVPPGFFKVPTVRNVDKRKDPDFIKAYTHNGWFKSLETLVHFYNTSAIGGATATSFGVTRCTDASGNPVALAEKDAVAANCWPAPEWAGASPVLVGNLGLTLEQEAALVAYMKALTDTVTPKAPPPYKPAAR